MTTRKASAPSVQLSSCGSPRDTVIKLGIELILAILIALFILFLMQVSAHAEGTDEDWIAGAINSEANSQPFPVQCAIATIVWKEAQSRHISVRELATASSYLSGWNHSEYHRWLYLNPPEGFRTIAKYAQDGLCTDYGARHFNGAKTLSYNTTYCGRTEEDSGRSCIKFTRLGFTCQEHPAWSNSVRLVHSEGTTCFYE